MDQEKTEVSAPLTPAQRMALLQASIAERRERRKLEKERDLAEKEELRALQGTNKLKRIELRSEKEAESDRRKEEARLRLRMKIHAEKVKAAKLAEREQKQATLAAEIARRNGGRTARTIAQKRIVDSFKPISERWQPRPEVKYL